MGQWASAPAGGPELESFERDAAVSICKAAAPMETGGGDPGISRGLQTSVQECAQEPGGPVPRHGGRGGRTQEFVL